MTLIQARNPNEDITDCRVDADGRLITTDGLFRAGRLLDYPRVGKSDTDKLEALDPAHTKCLYYKGAGVSGVLRSLWWIYYILSTVYSDVPAAACLKLWTGLGTLADPEALPNEGTYPPDAVLPIRSLLAAHYDPAGFAPYRSSERLDVRHDGSGSVVSHIRFPMPFQNGILLQAQGFDDEVAWPTYAIAEADTVTGNLPPSPFNTWRLRSATFDGAVGHEGTASVADVTNGPGLLAALFASIDINTFTTPIALENNWKAKIDGEGSPSWETSGYEDMFGLEAFYFDLGEACAPLWGCPFKRPYDGSHSLQIEAYRYFTQAPIFWNSDLEMYWTRDEEPGVQNVDFHTLALYYAPLPP